MQINYFTRFVSFYSSDVPSTPWKYIDIFLESDSDIAKKVKKQGTYIYYTQAKNGRFLHRYDLAQ